MRRKVLTATLISVLLITALAEGALSLAQAKTFPSNWPLPTFQGFVEPKPDTVPPEISISHPLNGSTLSQYSHAKYGYVGSVELVLSVAPPTGPTVSTRQYRGPDLIEVYYTTSWNKNETFIIYSNRQYINYWLSGKPHVLLTSTVTGFSGNVTVKDVPHGWQNITVYAEYVGWYYLYDAANFTTARFYINGSSSIRFFMDVVPPSVTVLSPLNQQYATQAVSLSFHVNASTSRLAFSLDGAGPTITLGNTTLAGLTLGTHNVTVYAWDTLGRKGTSETIVFTVSLFPAVLVAAVVVILPIAIVLIGLLFYLKKKRKMP